MGDSRRFMIVSFARKSREDYIRRWLENLIVPKTSTRLSIDLGDERYAFKQKNIILLNCSGSFFLDIRKTT
jgi:hypothetical protein